MTHKTTKNQPATRCLRVTEKSIWGVFRCQRMVRNGSFCYQHKPDVEHADRCIRNTEDGSGGQDDRDANCSCYCYQCGMPDATADEYGYPRRMHDGDCT